MARTRSVRSPALLVSALAHAALFAAALIVMPHGSTNLDLGKAVPVTLVTDGPPAELAPTLESPEPAPAMTPEPLPDAPAEPAPISPAPPSPPAAAAAQKTPAPAKPAPQKPAPSTKQAPAAASAKPAQPGLDLDALMTSIAASNQRPSTRESSGNQGANRARTSAEAQQGHGSDDRMSASELGALKDKLTKLWNPNCGVEGANSIKIRIRIRLTPDGRLAAPPEDVDSKRESSNAMVAAAAQRAVSAVGRGAPYTELNPEHYEGWRDIILTFDGGKACARR